MGKKNTDATRRRARQILYEPDEVVPKLFGPIRERYLDRPGGYTRVSRIEPLKEDQAESAILELLDGPKDLHFAMTAKTLARSKPGRLSPKQAEHVKKATQFRKDGVETLQAMIERMRLEHREGLDDRVLPPPHKVYPEELPRKQMHFLEETDDYKLPNGLPKRRRNPALGKVPAREAKEANMATEEATTGEPDLKPLESSR